MSDGATKREPTPSESSVAETTNLLNPLTTVTMSAPLTLTGATAATEEEVATMRCTNSKEAIAYEKDLCVTTEAAIKCLWKGDAASKDEVELKDVMLNLIKHFKSKMKIIFEPAEKANRRAVLESISDTEAHCIWDTLEDLDQSDDEMTIQEEADTPKFINWVDFLQLIDEDLTEDQMKCIVQLFKSHCMMLEHQAQVSHQLAELGQMLSLKMFLLVLQNLVWPMFQLTIPEKFMPKFPSPMKKPSRDEQIIRKVLPDSKQLTQWAENSATLYLVATIHYYVRKAISRQGNMKDLTKQFWVTLTALEKCINGRKYEGGSQAARKRTTDLVHK